MLGTYQIYNASMVTQDFGIPSATGQFLTGVVFTDSDANNFYSVGEGRGAVNVSYDNGLGGAGTTATGTAGAYSQRVAAGTELVSFSGGGLASPVVLNATIAAGTNAEIDLEISGGNTIVRTSVSISEASGIGHIVGLGTNGLNLAGDSGADIIDGTTGNDTIFAGAGSDTVIGGDGNDTLVANDSGADVFANTPDTLNGGNGNDTIYADSADTISGGAGFDVLYADQRQPHDHRYGRHLDRVHPGGVRQRHHQRGDADDGRSRSMPAVATTPSRAATSTTSSSPGWGTTRWLVTMATT